MSHPVFRICSLLVLRHILWTTGNQLEASYVHVFRYTARTLFRHMEWRYHGVPRLSVTLTPAVDLASHFVKRMNEASGIYQMFGILADVAAVGENDMIGYVTGPVKISHLSATITDLFCLCSIIT